jgi:hypothetical protein
MYALAKRKAHLLRRLTTSKEVMQTIELADHIFPAPSTIQLCGPSSSGKTSLVMEILRYRNQLFSQPVNGVLYAYSEYQDVFEDPPGGSVQFHYGLPTKEELESYIGSFEGRHFLLVCDDLMTEMAESPMAQDIMTKMSHHRNFSIININQNIFVQGSKARNQAVNSHFYILTRTCRDLKQISLLGSQMFPGKASEFVKVYRDAVDHPLDNTSPPHLLVACHPFKTQRNCQLLSSIFPPDGSRVLYRVD